MSDIFKIVKHQGKQFIPDPTRVTLPPEHPGKPVIEGKECIQNCVSCKEICPVGAIEISPVSLNTGKCVFCSECVPVCPSQKIRFTSEYKLFSNDERLLIVKEGMNSEIKLDADKIRKEIKRCFGRSLKLRLVSAGSCNGCELELNAAGNVNFDMGRYGIEFLASPRHCDGVVVTGPVVENSVEALKITMEAIPRPKILILAGACAISGGIFSESMAVDRKFLQMHQPDLLVPGCPPHPLTFINGILALIR
jgi:Ni,Fe-hydrogenase III small subunit/NAD-dependent dihydropyrimidine dehydrogenase PreA subunit